MPTAALQPLDVAFHIRRVLRHVSKTRPILLVFDDLHDFDTSTLSALYCLFRDLPPRCSVVLAVDHTAVTPEDSVRVDFEDQIVDQFSFKRLNLAAWSSDETRELAELLLGDRSSTAIASLVHRFTGGNPFFVVEVCAALNNQSDGLDRLSEDVGLPLTERLSRFVDRRLQRVAVDLRSTLDVAAVLGSAFPSLPIAACTGRDHIEVLRHLRALETVHHIVRSSELDDYRFTVPAIRERIYQLLGRDVAREQHLLIAQTLTRLYPGPTWDLEIGRHLLLGGHTDPGLAAIKRSAITAARENRFGDAADRFQRLAAACASTRASDTASRQHALLQTIACLRQQRNIPAAVASCRRLSSEAEISPLVAPALAVEEAALAYYLDDFERCVSKSQMILAEFSESVGFSARVQVRLTLSAALYHLGRWTEARHHYRRCFAEPAITTDRTAMANAIKRVNMFYIPELALPKLESLLTDETDVSPDLRFEIITNVGMNHLKFSDISTASRHFEEAINGFRVLGSHKQIYPLNNLALAEMLGGQYSSARHVFAKLVSDFSEEFERDCARSNEAVCALMEGDSKWAHATLSEMWARIAIVGNPVLMELVGNNLALALAARGRTAEAVNLIVATSSDREHVSLSFGRGRRHRVVKRLGGPGADGFLKATAADHDRLAISGRRDAAIFRDTDYEIGDLWFWE